MDASASWEAQTWKKPLDTTDVVDEAIEKLLDPISGSKAKGKEVLGIITIHVDDLFMTGGKVFQEYLLPKLRKDFKVGSEDKNDVQFVGQRIRWQQNYIEVDHERAIEELGEVVFDNTLREDLVCPPDLHTQFRSVLCQINWLQSRTQFQACYRFSRCASASAAPTIADVRALNKLVQMIRAETVTLEFWPLKGTLRLIGYPDAAYQNNSDKSSQRGQTIFLAEPRVKSGKEDSKGSLIDFESQKIKRAVLSTTVSELYAFMKCFGTCQFLRGLWMDMSGQIADIHMRTDAKNSVTTATTTHLPEQKETIHMIQTLRTEACSGSIHDLAHVVSADCLADCLTKNSAKSDALIKAVNTGVLPAVDKHPPFRELMKDKHKAYLLCAWIVYNIPAADQVHFFSGEPVQRDIALYLCSARQ